MDDLSISLFASQTLKIHLHGYIQVVAELYLGPDPIFGPHDHYISFSWVAANLTWDHLNHLWTHFIDSGYSYSTHWTYFPLITIKIEQSQAGILSLSWCGMQDIRLKSKKEMTMTIRAQSIPQHGPLSTHCVSVANDRSSELHSKSLNQCNAALSLLLAKIKCLRQRYRTLRVKRKRIEY